MTGHIGFLETWTPKTCQKCIASQIYILELLHYILFYFTRNAKSWLSRFTTGSGGYKAKLTAADEEYLRRMEAVLQVWYFSAD